MLLKLKKEIGSLLSTLIALWWYTYSYFPATGMRMFIFIGTIFTFIAFGYIFMTKKLRGLELITPEMPIRTKNPIFAIRKKVTALQ